MHMVQIRGGSAHPFQGDTQRAFPTNAPDTDSSAAKT
jgi:hypothetical protein